MKKSMKALLLCGMLGCLCYGVGDWLMLYGISKDSGSVESCTTPPLRMTAMTRQTIRKKRPAACALQNRSITSYKGSGIDKCKTLCHNDN